MENKFDREDEPGMERFMGRASMSKIAVVRHPRVFLSGIRNFSQLEIGFPIRIVSGMTGALNTDLLRVSV